MNTCICPLCQCEVPTWNRKIPENFTIYGMTMKEVMDLRQFAMEKGYGIKNCGFQVQVS